MGFTESATAWFNSYLSGRIQVVDMGGTISTVNQILCGVPQGSILGPLLFLLYVNDMQAAVLCKLLLYADDSALIVSGKCIEYIEQELSRELLSVSEWLIDNRLSLHLGKTESILFGPKRKVKHAKLSINCKGAVIQSKDSVSYLGAELDCGLSGEIMAGKVLKKCNSRLKFLFRKAKYLTAHSRRLLASALVQCHLDYACCFWYSSLSNGTKNQLQATQNRLVRFTLDLPFRAHIGPAQYAEVDWLPVGLRVKQVIASHVFRIYNDLAPKYMNKHFVIRSHEHNTRRSEHSYSVPQVGPYGFNTFFYSGIVFWNSLPSLIKSLKVLKMFKIKVKEYLFEEYLKQDKSSFVY